MSGRKTAASVMLTTAFTSLFVVFYMLRYGESESFPGWLPPLMLVWPGLLYAVNRLFLRKERLLRSLILLNCIPAAGLLAAEILSGSIISFFTGLLALVFAVLPCAAGARLAAEPPRLNHCILTLEGAAVMLVLFTFSLNADTFSPVRLLFALAGTLSALLALIFFRMEEPVKPKAVLLLACLFAALFGLMFVFISFGSQAGAGLVYLWHALCRAVLYVGTQFSRFLTWLFSLFGAPDTDPLEPESETLPDIAGDAGITDDGSSAVILFVILALIAVAAVVILILAFRKLHFRSRRIGGSVTVKSRTGPSFGSAVKRFFRQLKQRLKIAWLIRRHPDRPLELFYITEQSLRKTPLARAVGETPTEFLDRLQPRLDPEDRATVEELRDSVNRIMYGDCRDKTPLEGGARLRKAVRALK